MNIANVEEVKRDLASLLEKVSRGEEIVIASQGSPIAKLIPFRPEAVPRQPGYWKGRVRIAEDFDELPPDLSAAFGGETP